MKTIVSKIQTQSIKTPYKPAYFFLEDNQAKHSVLTFGELDRKARAIASYLQSNCKMGERVLLIYTAGLEFISAFLGCLYAGMIAVPVTPPRVGEFKKSIALIDTIAKDAGISGVLTSQYFF